MKRWTLPVAAVLVLLVGYVAVRSVAGSGTRASATAAPASGQAPATGVTSGSAATVGKPAATLASSTTKTVTPGAQASAGLAPAASFPAAGSYVKPGTVGYRGSRSALKVYTRGGAAPAGCGWQTYGLRCDGDLTLDHAWVRGSLYWNGTGKLTISQSLVEGRQAWYVVYAANPRATTKTRVTIKDSTLRWDVAAVGAFPAGYDVGPIWQHNDIILDIERNDISGLPQGINPAANAIIDSNWIHGLVQNGDGRGGLTHMDGIFSQGGSNILIQRNYVDAPTTTSVTAALFFQDLDRTDTNAKVYANFLRGGAYYSLRNETSVGLAVANNTFGSGANAYNRAPGSISTWVGNVHVDGTPVPRP